MWAGERTMKCLVPVTPTSVMLVAGGVGDKEREKRGKKDR